MFVTVLRSKKWQLLKRNTRKKGQSFDYSLSLISPISSVKGFWLVPKDSVNLYAKNTKIIIGKNAKTKTKTNEYLPISDPW